MGGGRNGIVWGEMILKITYMFILKWNTMVWGTIWNVLATDCTCVVGIMVCKTLKCLRYRFIKFESSNFIVQIQIPKCIVLGAGGSLVCSLHKD